MPPAPGAPARSRPAVPIALALLSGAVVARVFPGSAALAVVLALAAAVAALLSFVLAARGSRRRLSTRDVTGEVRGPPPVASVLLLLLAVAALGAARRVDADSDDAMQASLLALPAGGADAMLKGRVVREPETRFGGVAEVDFEVESGWLDDESPAPPGVRILARIPRSERRRAGDLLPGRRLELAGRLSLQDELRFPFGFDRAALLQRRGEAAVLAVETAWRLDGSASGPTTLIARAARRARRAIREAGLERDAEAVIRAMVLGDRGVLSSEAHDAFVATGTVHILVIAGLHVAILAAILSAIARALPLDGRGRAAIVALGLLVYVALAGPRPGAVRATVGAIVFVVAGASGRGGDAWNRLAVSLCAMLALDPRCVEEAGFVLSFGTVAGLLALARAFERALEGGARDRRFAVEASRSQRARAWLSRRLRRESAASLAAFVAHAPLVLVAFGQVAPAVVLANLPAIPLATLALGAGIGGAALGAVHPLLGRPLLLVAGLAARALVATVELLSRVPLATLDLARPSAAATALALGGAALALSLASGGAPRRRTRALLGVSAVFWLAAVLPRTLEAPRLEVVPERPGAPLPETAAPAPRLVLLPGRGGLAALLLLEDGRAIRIGSGGGRSVERSLARIAKDSGGPRSPDISLAFFQGEDGTEGPCELSGLPAGVSISLLGDDGARIVRVEANGRAALVLDDPGGRALARVLESVEEPRLHAQVLIAPARASVALRALVERTRPLVVVSRDARRGGPVSRALEEAGSSPLELASTGALEIELGEELSVRALR